MDPRFILMFLIFACGFVVMPALVLRYRRLELRHRERMAAFEKGIPIPPDPPEAGVTALETYQLRGLLWLAGGLSLSLTLFIITSMAGGAASDRARNLSELGYSRDEIRETLRSEDSRRRGLSALGILPASVGVAYLFFYYEQRNRRRQVKIE